MKTLALFFLMAGYEPVLVGYGTQFTCDLATPEINRMLPADRAYYYCEPADPATPQPIVGALDLVYRAADGTVITRFGGFDMVNMLHCGALEYFGGLWTEEFFYPQVVPNPFECDVVTGR